MKLSVGHELIALDTSQNSTRNVVKPAVVEKIGRKFIHLKIDNTIIQVSLPDSFPVTTEWPYQYLIFESKEKYQEYKEYKDNLRKFQEHIRHGTYVNVITPEQIKKINKILGI